MIHLFSITNIVRLCCAFLLIGALLTGLVASGFDALPKTTPSVSEVLRFLSYSLITAISLLTLVGHHRVVNFLWSHLPFLGHFVPNLNGDYQLESASNFPLKQQMFQALQDNSPRLHGTLAGSDSLQVLDGTLRIQLGILKLRITYAPTEQGASRSTSEVVSSGLRKNEDSGAFELSYVYRARVPEPRSTDEQSYYGAAQLTVATDRGRVVSMEGTYWTNRSWQNGLNTAGVARAKPTH